MDNLGGIFDALFGDGEAGEALEEVFDEGRPDEREQPYVVYERYLCGGPKILNINDR
jgi:hypothetical protein